jgi:outer membrane protein assembly factor BamA
MMKAISRFLLFILLPGLCLPNLCLLSRGQSAPSPKSLAQLPASARKLIAIKVTGSKRYPEEAIAAATGLEMGTAVNDDDFKKASRRLGDTGVFTDIA